MTGPPPLGGPIRELRECSRDLDFPNGKPCGKEPMLHICWTRDPDGCECGFVCEEHVRELALCGWVGVQAHAIGSECGMPGAVWDFDENRCLVPDEGEEAVTESRILAVASASANSHSEPSA